MTNDAEEPDLFARAGDRANNVDLAAALGGERRDVDDWNLCVRRGRSLAIGNEFIARHGHLFFSVSSTNRGQHGNEHVMLTHILECSYGNGKIT